MKFIGRYPLNRFFDHPLHQQLVRIAAGDDEGFAGVEKAVEAGGFVFLAVDFGEAGGRKGGGSAALFADHFGCSGGPGVHGFAGRGGRIEHFFPLGGVRQQPQLDINNYTGHEERADAGGNRGEEIIALERHAHAGHDTYAAKRSDEASGHEDLGRDEQHTCKQKAEDEFHKGIRLILCGLHCQREVFAADDHDGGAAVDVNMFGAGLEATAGDFDFSQRAQVGYRQATRAGFG